VNSFWWGVLVGPAVWALAALCGLGAFALALALVAGVRRRFGKATPPLRALGWCPSCGEPMQGGRCQDCGELIRTAPSVARTDAEVVETFLDSLETR